MPAQPPSSPSSPARAVLALVLWLALALGWSAYLLTAAHRRFLDDALLARTAHLATLLAAAPVADHQTLLDQAVSLDPTAAYAMLWSEEGLVLLHSDHALAGTFLNESTWPALDAASSPRIASLTLADIPLLEATVPLAPNTPLHPPANTTQKSPRTFFSLALKQTALDAQFRHSARGLLTAILAFTLTGAILIAAGTLLALRRLQNSRREIEQNARARTSLLTERGMLASVLAHEVRSPLTALRFNLHSLRSLLPAQAATSNAATSSASAPDPDSPSSDTARQIELTDRCEREIHRLDGMLNDFLLRTQVVNAPDLGSSTSINAVVREAVDFLMPALERKNIHVSLHLDPADPHVFVHPDELRQVILNLAANAQDAMPPPKGGTLAISTLAPPPPEAATTPAASPLAPRPDAPVTLLIRDSGTGIPRDLHERIFEPFFSTKPNGSGLGLALVRRVISGAGGTVFCESTPPPPNAPGNPGTTFRIQLPPAHASLPTP